MSTHATQTSPSIPGVNAPVKQGLAASQHAPNAHKQTAAQTKPVKKTRRRTGTEYLIAARQRRQQQEYQNYHHPPAPEDIWICEFCEYERIFGTPPEALIRQYEIKDRLVRKQEAERRRLLEKAKMKGRKGKKGCKVAAKTASAAHDRQAQHQQIQQPASMNHSQCQSQGTQSEEYYEDEYDDEYAQDDPPPPSPTASPAARRSEAVHPDPGKQSAVHVGVAG
jgi:hypothetical protein